MSQEQRLAALSPAARALLDRRAHSGAPSQDLVRIAEQRGGAPAPLSVFQQRLWLADQVDPESPVYNRPHAFQFVGDLDVRALERALGEVIRRHEVLRSTLVVEDGTTVQRVLPTELVPLPIVDLRTMADTDREKHVRTLLRDEARRPFGLAAGRLLRAGLLRMTATEHILSVTLHHIASDGWSDAVLFGELGALYDAFTSGRPSPLVELPVQYADYAIWQRARIEAGAFASELAYWSDQLASAPAVLDLPSDRPRTLSGGSGGARVSMLFSNVLADALVELGRQEQATLSMVLLAAFDVVLSRHAGVEDVVVGMPVAARTRTDLEQLVGFLSNTLALRSDLSGNPTFRELLARVRRTALDGYARQEIPIDMIVDALRLERTVLYAPLVQVLLNVRNTPPNVLAMTGIAVQAIDTAVDQVVMDLSLDVTRRSDGLHCIAEYSTALFDEETILRLLASFQMVLEAVVTTPDEWISRLPLVPQLEQQRVITAWNATDVPLLYESCVHSLIEAQVRRTPDAVAAMDEQGQLTYAALDRRANHVARALRDHGVGPEVIVGVCMERSLDLVVALLAVLKAGGAFMPLDPSYPAERLSFMLDDARPSAVVVDRRSATRLPTPAAPVIVLDAEYWNGSRLGDPAPETGVVPDNIAYLIYTSGSTGVPKGVLNTHRGLCNLLLWSQFAYPLTPTSRFLQKTPFSFDVSVWEFFWPLIAGAQLVLARPEGHLDSAYLTEVIDTRKITTITFVPSMLQQFLNEPAIGRCSSLRTVISTGEALPLALQQRFFEILAGPELYNMYGPTESAIEASFWKCERDTIRNTVPIGRPIANVQLYVLDAELQPVPIGVVGELCIGGVGVARGYLNRPELTAERFVPDPFRPAPGARLYRTGDRVRRRDDGVIDYLGRADFQVKIDGVRIELGEIEATLAQHEAVRECIVVMRERESETMHSRLVAYVVPSPPHTPSDASLRQHMRERLPDTLVPSAFVLLDALPVTTNGKVDRQSLPEATLERRAESAAFVRPRTPTETIVAEQWGAVLGVAGVGIHDNFFEQGGRSLSAVKLVAQLRAALGVGVPVRTVFEHPTVAELTAALLAHEAAPSSPVALIQQGCDGRAPLFLLHGDFNGTGLYSRALASQLGPEQPVYAIHPHEPGGPDTIETMAADLLPLIREAAPAGPYRIAGYCNGGMVAFEVAQQLRTAGEHVDLLTLVDVGAPDAMLAGIHAAVGYWGTLTGRSRARQTDLYLRLRQHVLDLAARLPPDHQHPGGRLVTYTRLTLLAGRGMVRRAGRMLRRVPRSSVTGDAAGSEADAAIRERLAFYARVMRSYVPRHYPGAVNLIKAEDRPGRALQDATLNWSRVADAVHVQTVPGDHMSMVSHGLGALSAVLREQLDRLASRS